MTRTAKWTVHEASSDPKWFTHNGVYGSDPTKVKKQGAGKGNWGRPGDEMLDDEAILMFNQSKRRNSNHQEHEMDIKQRTKLIEEQILA